RGHRSSARPPRGRLARLALRRERVDGRGAGYRTTGGGDGGGDGADAPPPTRLLLARGGRRPAGSGKNAPRLPGGRGPVGAPAARVLPEVCDEVLVASGDGERLGWLGLPQVPDALPDSGPLGGLVAGLEAATHPHVAVVAADMPFASPAVLRLLASLVGG